MNKEHILGEIRRTSKGNGGVPLGRKRFEEESGIRNYDWSQFWARWGDAVREAGFKPNCMNEAYDDEFLLEKLTQLTHRLVRVPTHGDIRVAVIEDPTFPSKNTFIRLGSKAQIALLVIAFCEANPGNDEVANLWRKVVDTEQPTDPEEIDAAVPAVGFVYLLKHGSRREYKIGRTNNPLRREGELGIELPEKVQPIHYIETDDPAGIEAYWHRRFADRRKEGEWFALTPQDVRAFKRWKQIY